jgi:SAM-dependent methyltransferase
MFNKKFNLDRFDKRNIFLSNLESSERILDVGCGAGGNVRMIRSHYPNCTISCIDLKDFLFDDSVDHKIHNLENDENMPFDDGVFDAIMITHVVEHLSEQALERLGDEIDRLLKVNGQVYVEAPNWTSMFIPSIGINREESGTINFFDDFTHKIPFTQQKMYHFIRVLSHMGIVKVGAKINYHSYIFDIFRVLIALLGRRRSYFLRSFANIVGFSVYGYGKKTE